MRLAAGVLIMRICFVNLLYAMPGRRGGLGEHVADLSQALAARGHQVTILTSGTGSETREGAVRVVHLGPLDPFEHPRQLLRPRYTFDRIRYFWRLRQLVAQGDYDIVEAADGGFEQLFMLWNRPCAIVTKLHGNFRQFHPRSSLLRRAVHALEAAAVRGSDAVYASSSTHAAVGCDDYTLPRERIDVVPCGVQVSELTSLPSPGDVERRFPDIRGRRIVLLSVGASPGRKGARAFVEAASARRWDDVVFLLLAADRDPLDGMPLPAHVLVLPMQDKPLFRALLAAAAVVVFPSLFESFSIATHEAMLLERPVVVSKHVPLDPPARDYPWLTVLDAIDGHTLAQALASMLEVNAEPGLLPADMRRALRAAYGMDGVADATLALYREVIERRRSAREAAPSGTRRSA